MCLSLPSHSPVPWINVTKVIHPQIILHSRKPLTRPAPTRNLYSKCNRSQAHLSSESLGYMHPSSHRHKKEIALITVQIVVGTLRTDVHADDFLLFLLSFLLNMWHCFIILDHGVLNMGSYFCLTARRWHVCIPSWVLSVCSLHVVSVSQASFPCSFHSPKTCLRWKLGTINS